MYTFYPDSKENQMAESWLEWEEELGMEEDN